MYDEQIKALRRLLTPVRERCASCMYDYNRCDETRCQAIQDAITTIQTLMAEVENYQNELRSVNVRLHDAQQCVFMPGRKMKRD